MPAKTIVQQAKVVALCIGAAIAYGLVHDQITARICVEYFSVAHPKILPTTSPTLLGLLWGVLATWWVGAALGFLLAQVSQAPSEAPPTSLAVLARRVALLLGVMALGALLAGFLGYALAGRGLLRVPADLARQIPLENHRGFVIDLMAHLASYLFGFVGGAVLVFRTWRERGSPRVLPFLPTTKAGQLRLLLILAIWAFVMFR